MSRAHNVQVSTCVGHYRFTNIMLIFLLVCLLINLEVTNPLYAIMGSIYSLSSVCYFF